MAAIRIAVVDDSIFIRKAMVRILEADPRIEVIGVAASGEELIDHLEEWQPDLISLDLSMPGMGGLRTLDEIMARRPTPVIILSSLAHETAPLTIEALHRGAVDFIDKQRYSLVDFQSLSEILLEKILQIVPAQQPATDVSRARPVPPLPRAARTTGDFDLLLLGASTGGPLAIQTVLEALGRDFRAPIVIVQHMPAGFTSAFAERLDSHLPFAVREATHGEPLVAHTAYLAPGGLHITLDQNNDAVTICLSEADDDSLHCPSVDRLFSSAAQVVGPRAFAALLTGMGKDGAVGLAALADAGAYTVAQDEESSVVFGMPRAAIETGAVREILPLSEIGARLRQLEEQTGRTPRSE
ncbi:MAG: chemotaxis-specific protein-glutamate methyltransferase CheB [Acidobacteriota bacterium]|nr:chemotaxis-specific protein-glutamate methyltransferase CheB [Acidobacteriota bacterium]